MRLVIKSGYNSFLFGKDIDVTMVVSAFAGAKLVQPKGYGADTKYIEIRDQEVVEIQLVRDDRVVEMEDEKNMIAVLKQELEEQKKDTNKYLMDWDKARKENEELKKKLETSQDVS